MRARTPLIVSQLLSSARRLARMLPWKALTLAAAWTTAWAAPQALIGKSAPDFALPPAAAGDNVRLSEYRGQPVMLLFWSSSCGVCGAQLAAIARLYETYRSAGLIVLGVSVDDDAQQAERYARAHPTHFPMLFDQAKEVGRAYQIDRLPTTVLIDRSGLVRYLNDDYRANDRSYISEIRILLDDEGV